MISSRRIPKWWTPVFYLLSLLLLSRLPSVAHAKVCLMVYQIADNDLEFYIRQDYEELSTSGAVANTDQMKTWIYYDSFSGGALPNTVDASGTPVTDSFTGSRYITYDPTFSSFRVDTELTGEQNSDEVATIQSFLEHAMADCRAGGYDSLMTVFSSHGGGFAGFGGDENLRRKLFLRKRQKQRELLQTNARIATAIRGALDSSSGAAGNKLDVLGFDSCLMQSLSAADDYLDITDHILGSEAVEPGHGWAYSYLESAPTALELAQQVVTTFIGQTQGGQSHQVPKLLSIVDTTKFRVFITALETFGAEMLRLLEGGDRSLHAFVSRSRASAVAFEGVADTVGSTNPSALDIGSWFDKFDTLCTPSADGTLGAALAATRAAYTDMIVLEGAGEGTAAGTGMHLDWPVQSEYTANTVLWKQILFNNANFATQITPSFSAFLEWFLQSGSPSATGDAALPDSVCGENAESDVGVEIPNTEAGTASLFIKDSGAPNAETGKFLVEATISLDASDVLVQYGVNLTTPLKELLVGMAYEPGDDYLFLWGGDVTGEYYRNTFSASWDYNFYFLNITGSNSYEALYVKDQGDGSKTIPVMFFPEDKREEVALLQYLDYLFFDFEYWIQQGARYGFLKFSVDETEGRINDNLGLYVSNQNGAFQEHPRSALGLLLPLIQVDAVVQGKKLTTLPGGFNQTVIEWSPNIDYNVLTTPIGNIFNIIPNTDAAVVAITAYNHGNNNSKPETKIYDISAEEAASLAISIQTNGPVPTDAGLVTTDPPAPVPTEAPETGTTKPTPTEAPATEATKPSQTDAPNSTSVPDNATIDTPSPTTWTMPPVGDIEEADPPMVNGTVISAENETIAPHSNIFDHNQIDELTTDGGPFQIPANQTLTPYDVLIDSAIAIDQVGLNQTGSSSSAKAWQPKPWSLFWLSLFMWGCF